MTDNQNDNVSILIAEDSKTQAEILRHLLDKAGYQVRVAYNGKEALEAVKKEAPTLILTDVVMPEMNGYELCSLLKADMATRNIPVILVTQLFDPRDVLSGLECGADNFIIKPYEPKYLLDRIEVILANRSLYSDESVESGVSVFFSGQTHVVRSNRQKILNILLSTYEIAITKNNELNEAKDRLASVNDQLSDANNELLRINDDLKMRYQRGNESSYLYPRQTEN
jgi:DNA-binding response OmpR family regulator